jgi:hypothetical protein
LGDGAEEGIFVRGLPKMNIRDIYLENIVLKVAKGAELAEAQQVQYGAAQKTLQIN